MNKILFVINNLNVGGAEMALVNLLNNLDYTKLEVDLLLFRHEGLLMNDLSAEVNLLAEPPFYKFFDAPFSDSLRTFNPKLIRNRFMFSKTLRVADNTVEAEQLGWMYLNKVLPKIDKEYDIAIGYLEKNPIYFVVDKVKAKKKIGYIHNDYIKLGLRKDVDYPYFEKLDTICTVSDLCFDTLISTFPIFKEKIKLVPNYISIDNIIAKSKEIIDEKRWDNSKTKIVSVGRLEEQKGYAIAIEVAKHLRTIGFDFKWYIIGEGSLRDVLTALIDKYELNECIVLLGIQSNPLKFMKQADIIVQTSIFEGKSIVIDEAKLLCKPIIVTNYPTAKDQIEHLVNGIIVDFEPETIAKEIVDLYSNINLQMTLETQLKNDVQNASKALDTFNAIL